MEKYEDYFNFSFRDKLKIRGYERRNFVKCYATNSIDDMFDNLDNVGYGIRAEIEIYLPIHIRVLPLEKTHTQIREVKLFANLGFKIPFIDFNYNLEHLMGEFSNFPFENQRELGIDILAYRDLLQIIEKTGFSYINGAVFKHFKNHKYPQLVNFGLNFPKRKIKLENKNLNLNPEFIFGY